MLNKTLCDSCQPSYRSFTDPSKLNAKEKKSSYIPVHYFISDGPSGFFSGS